MGAAVDAPAHRNGILSSSKKDIHPHKTLYLDTERSSGKKDVVYPLS